MGNLKQLPVSPETENILHQIQIETSREVERRMRKRAHRARMVTAFALIVAGLSMLLKSN